MCSESFPPIFFICKSGVAWTLRSGKSLVLTWKQSQKAQKQLHALAYGESGTQVRWYQEADLDT